MVLECDDSQANILSGGSWGVEGPATPWSESFTCDGQGDSQVFRAEVEHDYYADPSLAGRTSHDIPTLQPVYDSACPTGWLSVDTQCLYKTPPSITSGFWNSLNSCRYRNGWLASIHTKEIFSKLTEFSHQGVDYWIGASDINSEGTFEWRHGEEWKFTPPWKPGQLGDSKSPAGSSDWEREGQHCVPLDASHNMHDRECGDPMSYMCMAHKTQTALGGQVEGYVVEHGCHCDAGLNYEIQRTVEIKYLTLSSHYITAFQPSAYL